ncbi:MAG: serine/threonine protein kinase [Phycisphaeraceae bacterium]
MTDATDHDAGLSGDERLAGFAGPADWRARLYDCLMPPSRLDSLGSIGRYEVVGLLGAGGMGVVFQAIDPSSGGLVAVKTLRPDWLGHQELARRFLREANHLSLLDHPRLVNVLAIESQGDCPYFVMPLMAGGSLRDHIDRHGRMQADRVLEIALQVGRGLSHAHKHALTHRDIKPSNILVDEKGNTYLADFGLVRGFFDESIVDPGQGSRAGTPAYMSPKAAAGEPESISGDIYAFGAVLYELLSGRAPYTGDTHDQVLTRIKAGPPTALRELDAAVPAPLVRVVEGAMARQLRNRYAEMNDVLTDLERIESGRPPLGPHDATAGQRPRWHRGLLAPLVAAILAVLIAGLVVTLSLNDKPAGDREAEARLSSEVLAIPKPAGGYLSAGILADLNGDGDKELVLVAGDQLIAYDLSTLEHRRHRFDLPDASTMHLRAAVDTDGDGRQELVLATQTPGRSYLSLVSLPGRSLGDFSLEGTHYRTEQGYFENTVVKYCNAADLDGDGQWELIASFADGYAKGERGVACFDVQSQALRWTFPVAPAPDGAVFIDLDEDGKRDIVLGTYSQGTGLTLADGTSDAVAYLYGVGHDGTPRWRHDVNALYAAAFPLHEGFQGQHYIAVRPKLYDLDGDGRDEVYARIHGSYAYRPTIGSVHRIDPATGKPTHTYLVNQSIVDDYAVDLDRDGKLELLLTDTMGKVHILDHRLRKRRVVDLGPPTHDDTPLWFAGHIPAEDGSPRIVLHGMDREDIRVGNPRTDTGPRNIRHYHDARVIMTDANLRQLDAYTIADKLTDSPGFKANIVTLKGYPRPVILSIADRVRLLQWGRGETVE